jgi:hypothetical protein
MFDVDFSEVSFSSPVDRAIIDMYTKFSRKTWVYSKSVGVEGALEVNQWFADQLWQPSFADGLLTARTFVLDPRCITPSMPFEVLHQHPGDFVLGEAGHCVVGGGLVNMAFNFATFQKLDVYIKREIDMADAVRSCSSDYIYQWQQFNEEFTVPRKFSTIGMVSEFFFEWRLGNTRMKLAPALESKLMGVMRDVYAGEVDVGVGRVKMLDDRDVVPEGNVGRMCTKCGIVCLWRMYPGAEGEHSSGGGLLCGKCRLLYGHLGAVVIISDYMAYYMGLLKE